MNLDAITIPSGPGEYESLAPALRAVARAAGTDLDHDELCAALGISLVAIAGPPDTSPALWPTFGRDVFLTQTARLFGMQLRDLHPPEVAVDMLWADEFPQHFDLSYKPLIVRALENGQPVLAWRGWEEAFAPRWGVITAAEGDTLLGVVPGAAGRLRLAAPALQCYVVELYEARTPSSEELLAAAVAHADAYLNRPEVLFRRPTTGGAKLVTGPKAYDAWAAWLQTQRPGTDDDPNREAFRAYACALYTARDSARRFALGSDAVQGPDHAAILDSIASACESLACEVSPFCRPTEIMAFWSTAEGHQELLEVIHSAQAIDRQIADYIRRLAAPA